MNLVSLGKNRGVVARSRRKSISRRRRAVATRYDQLAENFLGMQFIASARYWIKFVHVA